MKSLAYAAIVFVTTSCAVDDVDGEHDSFIADGKQDTGGIAEGSPEALGVLAFVNSATPAQLTSGAGIASNAASAIDAYKLGDDETAGTGDDEAFETLAELDRVPFVGPVAFAKLLAYAESHGFIGTTPPAGDDPFAAEPCPGPALRYETANRPFGSLGFYRIVVRERTCTGSSSCTSWQDVPLASIYPDGSGEAKFTGELFFDRGYHTVPNSQGLKFQGGSECSFWPEGVLCVPYRSPSGSIPDLFPGTTSGRPAQRALDFAGWFTESCLSLRDSSYWIESPSNVRHEREAAILMRY